MDQSPAQEQQARSPAARRPRPAGAEVAPAPKEPEGGAAAAPFATSPLTPQGMQRLQRLVGNQAALRLLATSSGPPSGAAPPAGAVQRSVLIGRKPIPLLRGAWRRKTKTGRGGVGVGERNVGNMLADAKARYFDNKDQLYQYAQGQTDTVGYVDAARTWVRLPATFTVMGELHTEASVADLVKATGTKRFRHEGFTEQPALAAGAPGAAELTAAMSARTTQKNRDFGVAVGDTTPHHGEDFYPKVMRVLSGLIPSGGGYSIQGDFEAERVQMRFALLDVQRLHAAEPERFPTYAANQGVFDTTAQELVDPKTPLGRTALGKRMVKDENPRLLVGFKEDYQAHADREIARLKRGVPASDLEQFARHHDPSKGVYSSDEMKRYERERDLSMYQHIKRARDEGCLLYGLGKFHYQRLEKLLEAEGIPHTTVAKFLAEQKQKYP